MLKLVSLNSQGACTQHLRPEFLMQNGCAWHLNLGYYVQKRCTQHFKMAMAGQHRGAAPSIWIWSHEQQYKKQPCQRPFGKNMYSWAQACTSRFDHQRIKVCFASEWNLDSFYWLKWHQAGGPWDLTQKDQLLATQMAFSSVPIHLALGSLELRAPVHGWCRLWRFTWEWLPLVFEYTLTGENSNSL